VRLLAALLLLVTLLAALLLLVTPLAAQEVPKRHHRTLDKKFWVLTAVNVGVSIATSLAVQRCARDHGFGVCQAGGYGDLKAREGVRQGFTGGMILISFKAKQAEDEEGGRKLWWTIQAAPLAINTEILLANRLKSYSPRESPSLKALSPRALIPWSRP
jgi:hypothetical protein